MVNVYVYGIDQFVVGEISKELTPLLANVYETKEEEVNFIAPDSMVFHKGVEQTSWKAIIKVDAPEEMERVQKQVFDLLSHTIKEIAIHVQVEFTYHCRHDVFEYKNESYPSYLTEENQVDLQEQEYDEDIQEGEGDDEIYTGDIFEEHDCCNHKK